MLFFLLSRCLNLSQCLSLSRCLRWLVGSQQFERTRTTEYLFFFFFFSFFRVPLVWEAPMAFGVGCFSFRRGFPSLTNHLAACCSSPCLDHVDDWLCDAKCPAEMVLYVNFIAETGLREFLKRSSDPFWLVKGTPEGNQWINYKRMISDGVVRKNEWVIWYVYIIVNLFV